MSNDRRLMLYETSARSLMPATMVERRRLARNIAEVIDDLSGSNAATPRSCAPHSLVLHFGTVSRQMDNDQWTFE
jgi:hypothetical protein